MERVVIIHASSAERHRLSRLVRRLDVAVEVVVDAESALARVHDVALALVVLDADAGGLELCREIHDRAPSTLIILISSTRSRPGDRVAGLLAGADDVLSEPFDRDELLARIRRALDRRRHWISLAPPSPSSLSRRELEVLRLLAVGRSPQEIAGALVISRKTVVTHMQHVFTKLGVHSQSQAVAHAHLHGLVATGPRLHRPHVNLVRH